MTPGKEFRPITDQELARTTVYALVIDSWSGKENWAGQAEQSLDWPSLFFKQTSPALVAQAQVSGRFPIFLRRYK